MNKSEGKRLAVVSSTTIILLKIDPSLHRAAGQYALRRLRDEASHPAAFVGFEVRNNHMAEPRGIEHLGDRCADVGVHTKGTSVNWRRFVIVDQKLIEANPRLRSIGRYAIHTADDTARLWDAATAKETAVLHGHDDDVISAAFSPDGRRIVTASADKTARLWDVATAKAIAVLRGHDSKVYSAALSPDGRRIVTASGDKTARLWDTHLQMKPTKDLLAEFCMRLPGLTKLTRDEMRLAGYPDDKPEIDVCQ
jgi:dipeptidyl aminopeptidase/acylaminoacyl peptidase